MSEPLTAEELAAMRQKYEPITQRQRMSRSLADYIRDFQVDLPRALDEIERLKAELAKAREDAVSDRVKLDAALAGQKAALERCVGYTRELAAARATIQDFVEQDEAIDAARKESR